jgi:hypothetical protein
LEPNYLVAFSILSSRVLMVKVFDFIFFVVDGHLLPCLTSVDYRDDEGVLVVVVIHIFGFSGQNPVLGSLDNFI